MIVQVTELKRVWILVHYHTNRETLVFTNFGDLEEYVDEHHHEWIYKRDKGNMIVWCDRSDNDVYEASKLRVVS